MISVAFWPFVMLLLGALPALFFSCMTPLVAVAVVAATTMKQRAAYAVIGGVWFVDQLRLFGFRHCQVSHETVGWSLTLLVTPLLIAEGARITTRYFAPNRGFSPAALAVAFVVGFLFDQLFGMGASAFFGGSENYTREIITTVALSNLLWLCVYAVATRLCAALLSAPSVRRGLALGGVSAPVKR